MFNFYKSAAEGTGSLINKGVSKGVNFLKDLTLGNISRISAVTRDTIFAVLKGGAKWTVKLAAAFPFIMRRQ